MSINRKCVKITADGLVTEVVNHNEDEDWKNMGMRGREGHAELPIAEMMGYRLSIFMLASFKRTDPINRIAMTIYESLAGYDNMLKGTVFIFNESPEGDEADFTLKDLNDIIYRACVPFVLGSINE